MSNEFRQVDLMIGDVRRRRWTTERKLQIIEESYAAGRPFLRGAATWRCAKSSVSLASAPERGRCGGCGFR